MSKTDTALARAVLEALGLQPGDQLVVRRGGHDYALDLTRIWAGAERPRKGVVSMAPLPGGPVPTTRLVGREVPEVPLRNPMSDCTVHRVGCFVYPTSTNSRTDD